jgi:hypothetical protein
VLACSGSETGIRMCSAGCPTVPLGPAPSSPAFQKSPSRTFACAGLQPIFPPEGSAGAPSLLVGYLDVSRPSCRCAPGNPGLNEVLPAASADVVETEQELFRGDGQWVRWRRPWYKANERSESGRRRISDGAGHTPQFIGTTYPVRARTRALRCCLAASPVSSTWMRRRLPGFPSGCA